MTMNNQKTSDFNQINTTIFDFFKKTSQSGLDMINKSFVKVNDANEIGASWPVMEMMKQWSSSQNGVFSNGNGQKGALQKILAACLEQQKLYSNLVSAGFTCATKTMEALRYGAQNQNDPDETINICRKLAEEYCRCYEDFVNGEYNQICHDFGIEETKKEKNGKAETVKSKVRV